MGNMMFAFSLTLIAGLSTGIGSLIAFFAKKTNKKFLSISLGFSAGVMIYVSMIEIFNKAQEALVTELGEKPGAVMTVVAFFGGMCLIAVIDRLIPSAENPHEPKNVVADCEGCGDCEVCVKEKKAKQQKEQLMRLGVFTALAIGIHNFPEGMATFVSAFQSPEVAIPIVAAIAIHNIPEGMATFISSMIDIKLGITLTKEQMDTLEKLYELLVNYNENVNLTRIVLRVWQVLWCLSLWMSFCRRQGNMENITCLYMD